MKLRIRYFKFLFFLYFINHPLHSHVCIDVDEFHIKSTNARGMRISVFDSDDQAYKHISYHPYKATSSTRSDPTIVEYAGLRITQGCIVELPEYFDLEKYVLRSKGYFTPPKSWVLGRDYGEYTASSYKILYKNLIPKNPQDILWKLNQFKSSDCTPEFKITYNAELKPFTKVIPTSTKDNGDERGKIGEIATALTMISFGCFSHYPTQNTSNQGLDGAFEHPSIPFLFLTESKCRNESCSAENYLEMEMNEKSVISKIHRDGVPIKTTEFIENYIKKIPQNVFKGVHRIKPNGKSQWAVEPFNHIEYVHLTLSPASSEDEAIALIRNTIMRGNISSEKTLDLVLRALNLSSAQAIDILQGRAIQQPTTPLSKEIHKEEVKPTVLAVQSYNSPIVHKQLVFDSEDTFEVMSPATNQDYTLPQASQMLFQVPFGHTSPPATIIDASVKGVLQIIPSPNQLNTPPSLQGISTSPVESSNVEEKSANTRSNLVHFLDYLKTTYNYQEMADRLKGSSRASEKLITRLSQDANFKPKNKYKNLWESLKRIFALEFEKWDVK